MPVYVFLLCSLSRLMFFWLSKQRENLPRSCGHAFTTTFSRPIILKGGCQAFGSGYEAAVATARDEQCRVQQGLQGRANSLRTRCAGALTFGNSALVRKLPDSKQKLHDWTGKRAGGSTLGVLDPSPTHSRHPEAHKINRVALTLQHHEREGSALCLDGEERQGQAGWLQGKRMLH